MMHSFRFCYQVICGSYSLEMRHISPSYFRIYICKSDLILLQFSAANYFPLFHSGFLNFSTTDILGGIILRCGGLSRVLQRF